MTQRNAVTVSATIGVLAAIREPERILVGPSLCYIDDGDYVGGFTSHDIAESLDSNYPGWSGAMAPVVMGNPDRPELANGFCATDPAIARKFAHVTFPSDNRDDRDDRDDLATVRTPVLILQCADDGIAPAVVGDYVHERLAGSTLVAMNATGHCPDLSAPAETIAAIRAYL